MEKQKILSFGLTAILVVSIIFISGCIEEQEKPPEAPPEKPAVEQPASPTCPASCDDGNECTRDYCSIDTNYECKNDPLTPCCGNDICESSESYESCPEDCVQEAEVEISYMNVTPSEAKELIENNPDLVIIDFSPFYAEGHIPNAVNYLLGDESLDLAIPTLDKNKKYLIYCRTEFALTCGVQKLIDEGFKNIYQLKGNYDAWVAAGYEVEKSPPEEGEQLPEVGVITVDELAKHNNKRDCWIAYEGKVYDVTYWTTNNPLQSRCGSSSAVDVSELGTFKGPLETIT